MANPFRLRMHGPGAVSPPPPSPPPPPPPPPPTGSATLSVGTSANRQLASQALPQLLTFPAGNTISVTKSTPGAGLVQMTRGTLRTPLTMGAPAAAYTGIEGSGWNGTRPTQPSLTGKFAPSLQFITLAHNAFTGTRTVGAIGDFAKIASLDWMVEGTTVNQTTPAWVYYTDVNGIKRSFYGFSIDIVASNYTGFATDATRGIEVYAQANPQGALGASWVARVIGVGTSIYRRHVLYPKPTAAKVHGAVINIIPGLGAAVYPAFTTAGVDVEAQFGTWGEAKDYACGFLTSTRTCSGPGLHVEIRVKGNPGDTVTVRWDGDGNFNGALATTPRGFYQVTHDPGVTVNWDTAVGTVGAASVYPGLLGIEWIGSGHQFVHTRFGGFNGTPFGTNDKFWFRANGVGPDQCGWDMYNQLDDNRSFRGVPTAGNKMFREMVDCDHIRWHTHSEDSVSGDLAGIIKRNITRRGVSAEDLDNGTIASFGERIIGAGAQQNRTPYKSITLKWIGGGSPGFVSRPAGPLKFWAADGTTQIGTDLDISAGGDFQHLCDLINNVGGIGQATIAANFQAVCSVTTFGDRLRDRNMNSIDWGGTSPTVNTTVDGGVGTFSGQNNNFGGFKVAISSVTPTQFYSFFDDHMDDYQTNAGGGGWANVVRMNRQLWEAWSLQCPFFDTNVTAFFDCNLFYDNDTQSAGAGVLGHIGGYLNSGMVNLSNARTSLIVAGGTGGGWTDAGCTYQSMVHASWAYGGTGNNTSNTNLTDAYFVVSNSNPAPAINTNVLVGNGDYTTIYPGLSHHDPRPAGDLIVAGNMITPHMPFDAWGVEASATVPRGAKYLEPDLSSITGAQAAELAVVALCGPGQTTDTAVYTITGKDGVGNTGNTVILQLTVNAIDN